MPNPEQSHGSIRSARFDADSEQPYNSEIYRPNEREALVYKSDGWCCGACSRKVWVTTTHQPTQCSNENCLTEWEWILIEVGIKRFPDGFDFLPTISYTAVRPDSKVKENHRAPSLNIILGSKSRNITTHEEVRSSDDTTPEDKTSPVDNS